MIRNPATFAQLLLLAVAAFAPRIPAQSPADAELFGRTFDTHWQCLRDEYPYTELYGIDWNELRDRHRARAIAAANSDEFAWELARMLTALPDAHVSFVPSMTTIQQRWSRPGLKARRIERRLLVIDWPEGQKPTPPPAFADKPRAYPEIIAVRGAPPNPVVEVLAAGPFGSPIELRLRWPDDTETDHTVRTADAPNIKFKRHYGTRWLVTGRVGKVGYMRIRTFNPKSATLGPSGKMTTMLRAALRELADTDGLILDLRRNGGGLVAASDPFLGNLLEHRRSYRWGRSGGKRRIITPRQPRYTGKIVVIVDERSASGGEWTARILRDAGRATVIGGRTLGAEAAVRTSNGPDGSVLRYSGWPMAEPGVEPFQEVGIALDHEIPLTVANVRAFGIEAAEDRVRRKRFTTALEVLGAPPTDLAALLELVEGTETDRGH